MPDKAAYREFDSAQEAEQWSHQHYGDLLNMDPESALYRLIFAYTGSWYLVLNRLLRTCPTFGTPEFDTADFGEYEEEKQQIIEISQILNRHTLPENIIAYRFTHITDVIRLLGKHWPQKGKVFSDKAFFSTTLVQDLLIGFAEEHRCTCLLKIFLPKGIHGACVSFKTSKTLLNEQEFLLPPNVKMRIKKVHYFTWPIQIDCIALLNERGTLA